MGIKSCSFCSMSVLLCSLFLLSRAAAATNTTSETGGLLSTCKDVQFAVDKCLFVREHCQEDSLGYLNYIQFYYCAASSTYQLPILVLIFLWLLLLFVTIGTAASDYLAVNLNTISSMLGLSPAMAGVTFLAYGNGAPDLVSTYTAMSIGSGSLAVGELIGAASFITAVVAGVMVCYHPMIFRTHRDFYINVFFFTLAVSLVLYFLSDGVLKAWECIAMLILYVAYVFLQWYYASSEENYCLPSVVISAIHSPYSPSSPVESSLNLSPHRYTLSPRDSEFSYKSASSNASIVSLQIEESQMYGRNASRELSTGSETLNEEPKYEDSCVNVTGPSTETTPINQSSNSYGSMSLKPPHVLNSSLLLPPISPQSSTSVSKLLVHTDSELAEAQNEQEFDHFMRLQQYQRRNPQFGSESTESLLDPFQPHGVALGGHSSKHSNRASLLGALEARDDVRKFEVQKANRSRCSSRSPSPLPRSSDPWSVQGSNRPISPISDGPIRAGPINLTLDTSFLEDTVSNDTIQDPTNLRILETLFPTLVNFWSHSLDRKIVSLVTAPIDFLFKISIPVYEDAPVSENELVIPVEKKKNGIYITRWLLILQSICGPLFVTLALVGDTNWKIEVSSALLFMCAMLVIVWSVPYKPVHTDSVFNNVCRELGTVIAPRYMQSIVFIGFAISILWMSLIANEVIAVLKALGLIFHISDAVLGLTAFALGNSLPDLIANKALAKENKMAAFTACFASPMLNILVGIGVSGLTIMHNHGHPKSGYPIEISHTLIISGATLLATLLFLLIAVPLNHWKYTSSLGVVTIVFWVIATALNVIVVESFSFTLFRHVVSF